MKWEKMSRPQRRVAVAKEVIGRLNDFSSIESDHGYVIHDGDDDTGKYDKYFDLEYNEDEEDGVIKLKRKHADQLIPQCTVCARGAMMLAKTAEFNNSFLAHDLCSEEATSDVLSDCFNDEELQEIEEHFELWYSASHKALWADIEDPKDRLLAIMQNIIDNDGNFHPEQEYEVVE